MREGEVYLSRARVESSASHKVLFIFFLELCRQDFEERGLPGTAVATGDLRRWEGGRVARAARRGDGGGGLRGRRGEAAVEAGCQGSGGDAAGGGSRVGGD